MPKVSVVTGYYNRAEVLDRTVLSILEQTYEDFELLVFDDRSTDDTAERLRALAERVDDPRLRYVVHEENKGFVRGLRDAIGMTTGEYIAIQGSGDVSLPERLARQVELLDARPEVGAVGSWYRNVQEGLGTARLRTPDADSATFDDLLKVNLYSHGEVMIRRSVYDEVGGYREQFTFAQDRDLWLRIRKVAELATVPVLLYDRFVQFDGVSYVPAKVVRQTCFSIAASRLAVASFEDERRALAMMETSGPTAVVPVDDPVVQAKLLNAAVRMIFFGAPRVGGELAKTAIKCRIARVGLRCLAAVYPRWFMAPVRAAVRLAVGMKSDAEGGREHR